MFFKFVVLKDLYEDIIQKFMKKIIFLILTQFSVIVFSQNLSVAYEIVSKPDKNNKSFIETGLCLLNIDGGKSFFFSPLMNNPNKQIELISENKELADRLLKSSMLTTYIIGKEISKNNIIHYFKFDETFAYRDDINLKWQIKNNTKEILGYKCREAKAKYRGREYIAYYAEDLPIADGPYKFYGLPGLILEIKSDDGDYLFKAIALEKKSEDLDLDLKNAIITNRKKFLLEMNNLAKESSKNQKIKDKSNGMDYKTIINGKEVSNEEKYKIFDQMIWDFMKNHNNPIETDDIWIR